MPDQRQGGISWTDETWNVIRGCSDVSEGCRNCYAKRIAATRLSGEGMPYHGLAELRNGKPYWTGKIVLVDSLLRQPLGWMRPRRIFVNAMSDLFHEHLPTDAIDQVVAVMVWGRRHQFQVLTKRAHRMRLYLEDPSLRDRILVVLYRLGGQAAVDAATKGRGDWWPAWNIWWGVSVEDQESYDSRMLHVVALAAKGRQQYVRVSWLSIEPLIGPIDVTPPRWRGTNVNQDDWLQAIDWMVVGGESGPDARPMALTWVRTLRDRARHRTDMGRPWPLSFHFKQWGEWIPDRQIAAVGGEYLTTFKGPQPQRVTVDGTTMIRLGVKATGRFLDGLRWNEYPALPTVT